MVGQATDKDIAASTPEEAFTPSLLKAFSVFEQQCKLLEDSHEKLKAELDQLNLELEHKNAELALKLVEIEGMKERLSGILETITDAVILIDDKGEVGRQNPAAEELLNAYPDLWESTELKKHLSSETPVRDVDLTLETEHGRRIFMVTVLPMAAHDHADRLVIAKDVTEYRELLRRVEREDRLSALGHVAANVAHEIRNPLQAVEGFVTLLQRDVKDNPQAERQAGKIMRAARQLNGVVSNLLSYTREMTIMAGRHNIDAIVMETVEMSRPRAEAAGIELELTPGTVPGYASIDGVQVKQVVSNLIGNAIEACQGRADAKIQVTCGVDGSNAFIRVEDNGPGMTEEVCSRIFEPFFTSKSGGIGLGLALCRRIIDAHNGALTVQSEPGMGACFHIRFPQATGDKQ